MEASRDLDWNQIEALFASNADTSNTDTKQSAETLFGPPVPPPLDGENGEIDMRRRMHFIEKLIQARTEVGDYKADYIDQLDTEYKRFHRAQDFDRLVLLARIVLLGR